LTVSDRPHHFSYTVTDHADTIAYLLDTLQLQGCVLVGHSFGGAVAITLAAKRPDLVSQPFLAEANLDAGGGLVSKRVAAMSEDEFVTQVSMPNPRDIGHRRSGSGECIRL
jgi:pimeloyl-ACP methyl ester carboxylesterase